MKIITKILFFTILATLIYSCNAPEKSVGMNTWDGMSELKWHIGTEDPVSTVMEYEDAWRNRDFDKMRSMSTDSTTFLGGDGVSTSLDELIENIKKNDITRDSLGASLSWETKAIFSVDIAPGQGGELVHSFIDVEYKEDDAVNRWKGMQRWYIIEGKVVNRSSYWQDIQEEE
tara:strand:- start:17705 stop:18223 length:519 start_codon:yes stop_codon:yes gene_type:complete